MRGVSERVRGPGGVGCGEQRRGRRRSQGALAPAPAPGPAARRGGSWGRPTPPSPTAGRGPGSCREERRGRREGPAGCRAEPCGLPPGCGPRGVGRGRAGPQGGRPAALEEPREQKETATAPMWSKQPALAAAQRLAAASEPFTLTPSPPPPPPPSCASLDARRGRPSSGAGEVRALGRHRAEAGRDPGAPRSPLPSPPLHLALPPCPAPFPTWIPGGLANSLLRETGRGGGGY